ncbi:MAG: hypothetical protein ACK5JS_00350 [Mangrovibacterium sp.]
MTRGIIAGGNISFYNDAKDNSTLASAVGLQIGYQWSKALNDKWSFGLAGVFSQVGSRSGATTIVGQEQLDTYLAIPVSINYNICNFYLGTGYEYAYNISQNAWLNKNNHSAIFQLGYKLPVFDIVMKYNLGLNQEKYDSNLYAGEHNEISLPKINTLQLSVIVPIGK